MEKRHAKAIQLVYQDNLDLALPGSSSSHTNTLLLQDNFAKPILGTKICQQKKKKKKMTFGNVSEILVAILDQASLDTVPTEAALVHYLFVFYIKSRSLQGMQTKP